MLSTLYLLITTDLSTLDQDLIKNKLASKNIKFLLSRDIPGQEGQKSVYYSAKAISNVQLYVELKFKSGMNVCKITVKSSNKTLSELCKSVVAKILV